MTNYFTFLWVVTLYACTVSPQRPRYLVAVSTMVCVHSCEEKNGTVDVPPPSSAQI